MNKQIVIPYDLFGREISEGDFILYASILGDTIPTIRVGRVLIIERNEEASELGNKYWSFGVVGADLHEIVGENPQWKLKEETLSRPRKMVVIDVMEIPGELASELESYE